MACEPPIPLPPLNRRYEVAESSGGHSFEAPPPQRWVHPSAVGLLGELHHERHAHVLELRREVSQRITREQAELDQADRAERRRRKHEKRQGKKSN